MELGPGATRINSCVAPLLRSFSHVGRACYQWPSKAATGAGTAQSRAGLFFGPRATPVGPLGAGSSFFLSPRTPILLMELHLKKV